MGLHLRIKLQDTPFLHIFKEKKSVFLSFRSIVSAERLAVVVANMHLEDAVNHASLHVYLIAR